VSDRTDFDVVVIGSGAGGAPIASELARAGKSVLVLEKGPLLRTQGELRPTSRADFKRDELFNAGPERIITVPGMANTGDAFYTSHVEPDLNDEPHIYSSPQSGAGPQGGAPRVTIEGYTAQVVGGGTQLYGAVSLRFCPLDFQLQSFNASRPAPIRGDSAGDALRDVRDWPITYEQLEPYYAKAERLIGINGTQPNQEKPFPSGVFYQTPPDPNPISAFAKSGMEALGMATYRTPLAVITEDHAPSDRKAGFAKVGYVNRYGDPLGFKSNTWVSLLRPAVRTGADLEIRANCVATHLVSGHRRVSEVRYRDPGGAERVARGKLVVVACSAVESVRLLMISAEHDRGGFGKAVRHEEPGGLLGRFFLTHCFGGAETAIRNHRFDKSVSLDSDYATDACTDPDFLFDEGLWAGGAIYNNTSDQALPVALVRTHRSTDLDTLWLGFAGDMDKRGQAMVDWFDEDFGTRLSVSFMANQLPRLENRIVLHGYTDKWNRKVAHIVKDWHEHDGHLMTRMYEKCRAILAAGIPAGDRSDIEAGSVYGNGVRIANHILGGAIFGAREADSVLDANCRVWGLDNLYVTDGSFMPTSGSANPTLTIQANAFRVADALAPLV
jgi:choline dehydrogenase-like flavoprotein